MQEKGSVKASSRFLLSTQNYTKRNAFPHAQTLCASSCSGAGRFVKKYGEKCFCFKGFGIFGDCQCAFRLPFNRFSVLP
jgi:hypothetical protein